MKRLIITMFIVLAAICLVACGGKEESKQENEDKETKTETVSETEAKKDTVIETENETIIESLEETQKKAEKQTTETILQTEVETLETEDIPFHMANIVSIEWETDYSHIDTEMMRLGNDEKATIVLVASPAELNEEDIIFEYDEELVAATIEITSDESKNTTKYEYTISGLNAGTGDIFLLTAYDDYMQGGEAPYCDIPVKVLDSREGQAAYITPTGEKYHLSADCAGENAYRTTVYDAEAIEMKPCGKCAQ